MSLAISLVALLDRSASLRGRLGPSRRGLDPVRASGDLAYAGGDILHKHGGVADAPALLLGTPCHMVDGRGEVLDAGRGRRDTYALLRCPVGYLLDGIDHFYADIMEDPGLLRQRIELFPQGLRLPRHR